ncbi:MAG: ATP-dependent DNA helicase RecG [Planctomycetota bacterium]|jgi:ATP-dependent DNA helicase RecG
MSSGDPRAASPSTAADPEGAADDGPERLDIAAPLTALPRIGPARAAAFARIGVECVGDLLRLAPARVERIGPQIELKQAAEFLGRRVWVRALVRSARFVRTRGRSMLRVSLEDESGRIDALFFNQPWLRDALPAGREVELYGPLVDARGPALQSPRLVDESRPLPPPGSLLPIYPDVEGASDEFVRELVRVAWERAGAVLEDPLPRTTLEELELLPLGEALEGLQRPDADLPLERARRRLALEPVLELQARLQDRLGKRSGGNAPRVSVDPARADELLAALPFEPTGSQRDVFGDVLRDLGRQAPMRRLVQGDVGSGKTAVALLAARAVAEAGHQAAILAPTELLAEQHHLGAQGFLEAAGLRTARLTASLKKRARSKLEAQLAAGEIDVIFGTHALLSEGVEYAQLALAIVDEQHRFGVGQRRALLDKGEDVHMLLMTATPIPRTLALTLYGDMEASSIRELPPGRTPVQTRVVTAARRERLIGFVAERLARGERAYWVSPRIRAGEDGKPGAEELAEALSATALGEHGVVLAHGQLDAAERAARVEAFRRGEARLLVGTTVIEVGVDVPEATVICIDEPERFGLSQLHQLRGRVGRGPGAEPWCFLCPQRVGANARERLRFLTECHDGFALAEEDLRQRGMGDLLGVRQAGDNSEGLGGGDDLDLVVRARELMSRAGPLREHYLERARRRPRD